MKKLVIAVVISAIASLGLVSCSAVSTESLKAAAAQAQKIAEKKLVEREARQKEQRFLNTLSYYEKQEFRKMTPEQKKEFRAFNKWEQGPEPREIFNNMTRYEGQHYDNLYTYQEKRDYVASLSPEGKKKKAAAEKADNAKWRKIAKDNNVSCTNTPRNKTISFKKLVKIHRITKKDARRLELAIRLLTKGSNVGKKRKDQITEGQFLTIYWNTTCKELNSVADILELNSGESLGKWEVSGTLLASVPDALLLAVGQNVLEGETISNR